MFKHILGATVALLIAVGSVSAHGGGGGGGGHGGGGGGGGRGGGGFGGRGGYGGGGYGGYGGYGGFGRGYGGFYGGYGGWGLGGWGYPYYGYGLGGYGLGYDYYPYNNYPYYGGYSDLGGYGYATPSGAAIAPYYSSSYPPSNTTNIDPTSYPILPAGFAPPAAPTAPSAPAPATVAVLVPQGGQIWFNGTLSPPKTGSKWVYTSDKLEPGKTHVLNIKARWEEGGKEQSYTIPLRMEAGDNMTVDLTKIH